MAIYPVTPKTTQQNKQNGKYMQYDTVLSIQNQWQQQGLTQTIQFEIEQEKKNRTS